MSNEIVDEAIEKAQEQVEELAEQGLKFSLNAAGDIIEEIVNPREEAKSYRFAGKDYPIVYLNKKEFQENLPSGNILRKIYNRTIRAKTDGKTIFIRRGALLWNYDKLMKHMVGLILGLPNAPVWRLTIMNPFGFLRWFNTW